MQEVEAMKAELMKPQPLHLLVCSASETTLKFLENMFEGFNCHLASSLLDSEMYLRSLPFDAPPLDFVILDDQSEAHAEELARCIRSLNTPSCRDTKVVHLYTPTNSGAGQDVFQNRSAGVVKMTKPPRKARMFQFMAGLKNLPNSITTNKAVQEANELEKQAAAQRVIYGNVLVAEGETPFSSSALAKLMVLISLDNAVARALLVKQLEKYDLCVTATSNGEEAIAGKKGLAYWKI